MDTTLYVGLSRQMTLQRSLDLAANNIANVDTAGFKAEQLIVNEDPLTPPAPMADTVHYVFDTAVGRDFTQGSLEATGNPFDLAIEGQGFFAVQTSAGQRYTRDGRFAIDAQNQLVTQRGEPLLSDGGAPIVLDPLQPTPAVGTDGTITQGRTIVGRVGVVRFPNIALLSKEGDNLYSAAPTMAAVQAPDAGIRQGTVEKSNVNSMVEITHLIEITRAYEQVAKMMDQTQQLASSAVQRLGQAA